jgi:predicted nucleic acid-binding protein
MPEAVVADAGPLIALAKLNVLHLLKALYGEVHVPTAVYDETIVVGMQQGFEDAQTLRLFLEQEGWEATEVGQVADDMATLRLDRGEQEAIELAGRMGGLLLMDEEVGREAARQRGIAVHGTLGILIEAYRRDLTERRPVVLVFRSD